MISAKKTPAKAYIILVIGLISVSFSPILVRYATEAPGLAVATWRTLFAAGLIAPLALHRLVRRRSVPLRRRQVYAILGAALFLGMHFVLWIESLYHTSVASASVLVATTPIFLGILSYVILKERLSPAVVVAIVMGVGGAVMIAGGDVGSVVQGNASLGNMMAISASLAAAVYLLIGGVVRQGLDWLSYVAPLYVLVAIAIFIIAIVRGTPLLGHSAGFYALCLGMAVGPQLLGHGSFNYAIRYISPTLISLLILTEPIVSSILAFFLFAESPEALAVTGMVVVLISVALAVIGPRYWPKSVPEAAH